MKYSSVRTLVFGCILACGVASAANDPNPAANGFRATQSDARAIEVADECMAAMGGRAAWDQTRYVRWDFFGKRMHYWDKWTGDVRIEYEDTIVLMNLNTHKGRAWVGGKVASGTELDDLMDKGYAWWVNDSYWAFMPYKLKDSGVALTYRGERAMQDGRSADVLELTFADVGLTPENRYEVLVDKQTHLVGEWSYYRAASDTAAAFTLPWKDWRQVGHIMLCGDHGRASDWKFKVYNELPRSVFESPEPVSVD